MSARVSAIEKLKAILDFIIAYHSTTGSNKKFKKFLYIRKNLEDFSVSGLDKILPIITKEVDEILDDTEKMVFT